MRTTHTFVELPVSDACYREIADALTEADYGHAFIDGRIDMHGIAITNREASCVCPTQGRYNCNLKGVTVHIVTNRAEQGARK